MSIVNFIQNHALELNAKGILSRTRLMYEVMNEMTDEEMYSLDTDLVDIAEKIEHILEKEFAL
ncbi:hypothetical protein [Paenibacillus sp. Soil724D2]|uniref:hypothetical protein n=1 Tax=Paenibacillus sp. (strain Soil724D2) TaxID=1736392 RepID=UPI0007149C73|nr:hypothetical protein [Paenibacillus sp. Soil724D2]KRE33462.1 hypothetical protein ASG85_14440 [Paenibacillus sp. Soil724D2]